MPGSVTSVFGEAEGFEAALRDEGCTGFLVTKGSAFRARLTKILLDRLRLVSAEEELPRIFVIAVPANTVLVSWAVGEEAAPVWGGIELRAGEMLTLSAGSRLHVRTDGPCRWHMILMLENELLCYGHALCGARFVLPPGQTVWRPSPAAGRRLGGLHRAAIRKAAAGSRSLADLEAAHGLEQQVIEGVIECLCSRPLTEESPTTSRYRGILAGLEDLLQVEPMVRLAKICTTLGVSQRLLRRCCERSLGMSPRRYQQLRRMQLVNRVLRSESPDAARISAIAKRFGFRELGRFAASYRALYGELPSTTLRRASQRADGLSPRRSL